MQILKHVFAILLAAMLVACGGGGGSAGTVVGGGTTTTPTTTTTTTTTPDSKVADFILYLDKSSITNGGTDKAQLTVVAIDASNNVVPGASVSFKGDAGTVVTPVGVVTDAAGSLGASIGLGADKSNRQIGVAVTVNSLSKTTTFAVVGTVLTVNPTPAVVSANDPITLQLSLKDSAGVTIPSSKITFTGDIPSISGSFVISTSSAVPNFVFAAPSSNGVYNITAIGGGVSASTQIRVSSGGASSVPAAVIPAGVTPSLSISPTVLATNTVGSNSNQSTLRLLVLDAANTPIPNVRVRFEIVSTGVGSVGSSIGTGVNTVYTSASGAAFSTLIAGNNNSPTNGVTVRACYSAIDFTSAVDCPAFVTAFMTIASQALGISIGEHKQLGSGIGIYEQQLAVTVVDSAGRAVADAPVDISLDITHYGKGVYSQTPTISLAPSAINVAIPDLTTTPAAYGMRILCPNEDTNRNGSVDSAENINSSKDPGGSPTLEPRRADVFVSYADAAVTKTDANGRLIIKVTYLQTVATWEVYRVRASTTVGGSQGTADRAFFTNFIEGDDASGAPFKTPPYGFGSCSEDF